MTGLKGIIQIESGAQHALALRNLPAVLSAVALAKAEASAKVVGSLWIWGMASIGGQGILGKSLRVPTLLELP